LTDSFAMLAYHVVHAQPHDNSLRHFRAEFRQPDVDAPAIVGGAQWRRPRPRGAPISAIIETRRRIGAGRSALSGCTAIVASQRDDASADIRRRHADGASATSWRSTSSSVVLAFTRLLDREYLLWRWDVANYVE
jgi:hypothetical protein